MLPPATGTGGASAPALLLPHRPDGLRGIGEANLALLHRGHDLPGHHVLPGAGPKHQLEQHPLFELLDGIDHGPPLVPLDGPGGEDAARGQHVHAQRGLADPALPHGPTTLLFVQARLRVQPVLYGYREHVNRGERRERDPRGALEGSMPGR